MVNGLPAVTDGFGSRCHGNAYYVDGQLSRAQKQPRERHERRGTRSKNKVNRQQDLRHFADPAVRVAR